MAPVRAPGAVAAVREAAQAEQAWRLPNHWIRQRGRFRWRRTKRQMRWQAVVSLADCIRAPLLLGSKAPSSVAVSIGWGRFSEKKSTFMHAPHRRRTNILSCGGGRKILLPLGRVGPGGRELPGPNFSPRNGSREPHDCRYPCLSECARAKDPSRSRIRPKTISTRCEFRWIFGVERPDFSHRIQYFGLMAAGWRHLH